MNNHFKIIVPFYNAQKWVGKSIKSIMLQEYDNFSCIVADDCSTDDSYELCQKVIGEDKRFLLVKNDKNLGPLGNAYESALRHFEHSDKNSIIVILDGDDFLYGKNVLSTLNRHYNDYKCWMTYGSYINLSDKKVGKFSKQVPQHVTDNNLYRNSEWCTSHLRSYKMSLLQKICKDDLLDKDGHYFRAAGDLCLMFPLLEMSGHKAHFIKDILYIWNDLNDLNEHKSKRELQLISEQQIRSMKKYDRLGNL